MLLSEFARWADEPAHPITCTRNGRRDIVRRLPLAQQLAQSDMRRVKIRNAFQGKENIPSFVFVLM